MEAVCRLCLAIIEGAECESVDDRNAVTNREKINALLPEITIDVVEKPHVCVSCSELLRKFHDFRLLCLRTEKVIRSHMERGAADLMRIARSTYADDGKDETDLQYGENPADIVDVQLKEENAEEEVPIHELGAANVKIVTERVYLTNNIDETLLASDCDLEENLDDDVSENSHADFHETSSTLDIDTNPIKLEEGIDLNENCQTSLNENATTPDEENNSTFANITNLKLDENLLENVCEIIKLEGVLDEDESNNVLQQRGLYVCRMCKHVSTDAASFSEHFKVHGDLKFKCDACNKTFTKNWDYRRHVKTHEKVYMCQFCGASFSDHKALRIHRAEHSKDPIVCDVCRKCFTTRSHLKTHVENIHGAKIVDKKFECEACKETFGSKYALLKHSQLHYGKKDYVCEVCGKGYRAPSYLRQHMRNHSGVRPHQCPTCGMSFLQKHTLTSHMRTHSGEKPYNCDKCGKGFAQHGTLSTHLRSVHSTEKRYTCDLCPMKFMFKVSLRLHLQKHMGQVEKRHTCDVCGKSFRLAYALKTHALRHVNGSTHTCIVCERGFIGSGALKRHMRTHTGEKPYECHICHFKCTQKYNLRIHINSHIKNQTSAIVNGDGLEDAMCKKVRKN